MLNLIDHLYRYRQKFPSEQICVDDFIQFLLSEDERPFHRENLSRHITASAWLVSPNGNEVLLTHHKKLGLWVQLGGHCDGDQNVLDSALREATEESGITGITTVTNQIFDIDKHLIPARKEEPEHFHYDIRFLFRAPHRKFVISFESNNLEWVDINSDFFDLPANKSLQRMHTKWMNWLQSAN